MKQFENFTVANEIYDYVMEKYDQTSKSHFFVAFRAYVNYKMHEGTSIKDHIDQMSIKHSNLATLGKEMGWELQIIYLLMSLPPSWENACQTLSL